MGDPFHRYHTPCCKTNYLSRNILYLLDSMIEAAGNPVKE
ncbi:hypothetical protein HM1_1682 [Heliomicrobium modesticaldum Ice1]|uniref:Uncharacterized protein n=1 Tax=Heliobacterium modesticaldum (strain ATCC 51547 / Ice1) TaxID=498761 RepID=B0TE57_HELMI|nr:hypothetical protein HM1_1682 [Heliomicrobium modesticaldum Ice1]